MKHVSKIFTYLFGTVSILLLAQTAMAQGTVSGTISDANASPIAGATVLVVGTTNGTISQADGSYSLEVPAGEQTISASFISYSTITQTVTVTDGGNVTLDFTLTDDVLGLNEIIVTGSFSARSQKEAPTSMTLLNSKQLGVLSFNSQADVLRSIPGITAEGGGGEVASNVFVRGMPSGGQYQFTPLQVDGLATISTFGLNSSAHDVYFRNDIGIRNLEFIRGGSATLFGAGSVAGIINYTSHNRLIRFLPQ